MTVHVLNSSPARAYTVKEKDRHAIQLTRPARPLLSPPKLLAWSAVVSAFQTNSVTDSLFTHAVKTRVVGYTAIVEYYTIWGAYTGGPRVLYSDLLHGEITRDVAVLNHLSAITSKFIMDYFQFFS